MWPSPCSTCVLIYIEWHRCGGRSLVYVLHLYVIVVTASLSPLREDGLFTSQIAPQLTQPSLRPSLPPSLPADPLPSIAANWSRTGGDFGMENVNKSGLPQKGVFGSLSRPTTDRSDWPADALPRISGLFSQNLTSAGKGTTAFFCDKWDEVE